MRLMLRAKTSSRFRYFWDVYFLSLCVLVVSVWSLTGCSKDKSDKENDSFLCDCSDVPADQHGSCLAPLRQRPTQIRVAGPEWDLGGTSRLSHLQAAVAQWNQTSADQPTASSNGGTTPSFTLYVVNDLGPYRVNVNDPRNCENLPFGIEVIPVQIIDLESWRRMGLSENVPAITLRCAQKFTLASQRILILRDQVNTPQIQSILLHELGHTIGLDHSCQEGSGSANYVGCSQVSQPSHQYRQAVMFPTLQVVQMEGASGQPNSSALRYEKKESLTPNDQARARCVQRR